MSRRKQSDINPSNIGRLFFKPGEEIPYRLISCDAEPRALLAKVSEVTPVPNAPGLPVSTYKDYRIVPESLVAIPEKPKPPRADKGKTHIRRKDGMASARVCPTHKIALTGYGDKWQCPQTDCDYEEASE